MSVSLTLLHSDLFDALGDRRYDAILFNPPFHDAEPRTVAEKAWCGGEVVRRCLANAPHHLTPDGALYLLMPRIDQRRYASELARWSVHVAASRWYPLLGRTDLLVLRPR
jgi:16S rRNA G1207 methylase RsmC